MKILKIEYIEKFQPNSGSGTGYSEPDKFRITCDSNLRTDIWHSDSYEKEVWIDTWYVTKDRFWNVFKETINKEIGNIENMSEAFAMYLKEYEKIYGNS